MLLLFTRPIKYNIYKLFFFNKKKEIYKKNCTNNQTVKKE